MVVDRRHLIGPMSLLLFTACWFLPILDGHIGFDGARFAHQELWKLLTEGHEVSSLGDVFMIAFISIGWLANELYVVGVLLYFFNPRTALNLFAGSFGIMISWQVAFLGEFPLLVGYWFWVIAGGLALWLVNQACPVEDRLSLSNAAQTPLPTAFLLVPVVIAAIGLVLGVFR